MSINQLKDNYSYRWRSFNRKICFKIAMWLQRNRPGLWGRLTLSLRIELYWLINQWEYRHNNRIKDKLLNEDEMEAAIACSLKDDKTSFLSNPLWWKYFYENNPVFWKMHNTQNSR